MVTCWNCAFQTSTYNNTHWHWTAWSAERLNKWLVVIFFPSLIYEAKKESFLPRRLFFFFCVHLRNLNICKYKSTATHSNLVNWISAVKSHWKLFWNQQFPCFQTHLLTSFIPLGQHWAHKFVGFPLKHFLVSIDAARAFRQKKFLPYFSYDVDFWR